MANAPTDKKKIVEETIEARKKAEELLTGLANAHDEMGRAKKSASRDQAKPDVGQEKVRTAMTTTRQLIDRLTQAIHSEDVEQCKNVLKDAVRVTKELDAFIRYGTIT
jgi:hypothetical protein